MSCSKQTKQLTDARSSPAVAKRKTLFDDRPVEISVRRSTSPSLDSLSCRATLN